MSIWHLVILAIVVVLLFGTSKLRNVGSDLGAAIREFKKSVSGDEPEQKDASAERLQADPPPSANTQKTERDRSESK